MADEQDRLRTFRKIAAKAAAPLNADQLAAAGAQTDAAKAVETAKADAAALAKSLGAKIDPATGKIDVSTVDVTKIVPSTNKNTNITDPFAKALELLALSLGNETGRNNLSDSGSSAASAALAEQIRQQNLLTERQMKMQQEALAAQQKAERKSAFDLLYTQFAQYGLGSLVEPLKSLIEEGVSPAEFTIRLRETDSYKKRFAANTQRINKGLRALSEAEYIGLEDQYQNVMRNYGLPESYYQRGDMGIQQGFEKFIAGDVSTVELEDRIQTAQNRVINAAPEVSTALREFYPDITNGDILAYALDPEKALTNIKRKVTAAEIGAGAMQAGLVTGIARAEELQRYGITGEQARQGYQTVGSLLPRGSQLGSIYKKQGLGEFTQATAESEVFGTPGAIEAANKRRKLAELEQAQFGGSSGIAGGALARERAGSF